MLSYYRKLAALRQQGEAAEVLIKGSYEELLADNPYILAFKRKFEGREVYTVVNFTDSEQSYQLPEVEAASLLMASIEDSSKGSLRAFEAQIYICQTC